MIGYALNISRMAKQITTRRRFIYNAALAGVGLPLIGASGFCNGDTSQQNLQKQNPDNSNKLGIALVGLGSYATHQLAPALQQTKHAYLAGIVTGTPSKIDTWQQRYSMPDANVYNYSNFDEIIKNKAIDIVYVVLPNSMHAEYVIRAAKAGKHVICEKPMAITVDDCTAMINACQNAGRMLSIGYRLHFEPYNLTMARLGTQRVYGAIKKIDTGFGFTIGDPTQWRLKKALSGGGPLQDVGIYSINATCYTSGQVPTSVIAQEGPKTDLQKFAEVEQSLSWQFTMPDGYTAYGKSSYAENYNYITAYTAKGDFGLTSAFGYNGQKGFTPDGIMQLPAINQQAAQIDDFAQCIINKKATIVPGQLGRRDVILMQAIYESIYTGKSVAIKMPDG